MQADVHETVLFVIIVEIEVLAFSPLTAQLWKTRLGTVTSFIRVARLDCRPDTNQTGLNPILTLVLPGHLFLADVGGFDRSDAATAFLLSVPFRRAHQLFGLFQHPTFVSLIQYPMTATEIHNTPLIHKRQNGAFEDNSVESSDNAFDNACEFLYKCVHGPPLLWLLIS